MVNKEYEQPQGLKVQWASVEIYRDTESYDCDVVLNTIKKWCEDHKSQYVIMLHDKDIYSKDTFKNHILVGKKGDKKKPHYHCLVSLPYRRYLNDLSIAFGIEDRWIKKLKTERDFDNMIVYVTHLRNPEKQYYPPENWDTNIREYCEYIYNLSEEQMENDIGNPVHAFLHNVLRTIDHIVTYQFMYRWLEANDFTLMDIQKSWKILSDMLIEHNRQFEMVTINERLSDKCRALEDDKAKLMKNLDVVIEENMRLRGISEEEDKNIFDEEE